MANLQCSFDKGIVCDHLGTDCKECVTKNLKKPLEQSLLFDVDNNNQNQGEQKNEKQIEIKIPNYKELIVMTENEANEPAYICANYPAGTSHVCYEATVADAIKFCSLPETSKKGVVFYGWMYAKDAVNKLKKGNFTGGDNRFDELCKKHGLTIKSVEGIK